MAHHIYILEDNANRTTRFRSAIHRLDPLIQLTIWCDANAMVIDLSHERNTASLISLDHDLYPSDGNTGDPGDGFVVAKYLATVSPSCPVIIHSSNADRARMMQGELQLAKWQCERLLPFGADWIEREWASRVRSLIDISI